MKKIIQFTKMLTELLRNPDSIHYFALDIPATH